jgi:hypothetical protein
LHYLCRIELTEKTSHEIGEPENPWTFPNLVKLEVTIEGLKALNLPVVDLIIREVRKPLAEPWDNDQWECINDALIRVVMNFYLACKSLRSITHVTYQAYHRVNDIQEFMEEDLGEEGQSIPSSTPHETILRWDIKPGVLEEFVRIHEANLANWAAAAASGLVATLPTTAALTTAAPATAPSTT